MSKTTTLSMDDLLNAKELNQLKSGDMVDGKVLSIKKHEAWIDLGPFGLGILLGRDLQGLGKLEIEQEVSLNVVDPEMDEGYALLSLKNGSVADVAVVWAATDEGVRGFLPVSQLAPGHYPRVLGADKDEILQKLSQLNDKPISVKIIDISRKDNKLIFSEKEAVKDNMQGKFSELKVGDVVEGLVTGVIDYGAFVNVDGIEGLIHISEISWERVEDPRKYIKVGEKVEAKIIAIDKDRLSLSLKQMQEDPWLHEVKKFKKGDTVEGKVTRITPFGAFVQLSPSVEALVHVSEMSDDNSVDPEKIFQLNEKKKFKVLEIDLEGRKIALSLKDAKK